MASILKKACTTRRFTLNRKINLINETFCTDLKVTFSVLYFISIVYFSFLYQRGLDFFNHDGWFLIPRRCLTADNCDLWLCKETPGGVSAFCVALLYNIPFSRDSSVEHWSKAEPLHIISRSSAINAPRCCGILCSPEPELKQVAQLILNSESKMFPSLMSLQCLQHWTQTR